jgi:hypothetical protein
MPIANSVSTVLTALLLLGAASASAEVLLRLRDGTVARVPVDASQVVSVELQPGGVVWQQAPGSVGPGLPAGSRGGQAWTVNDRGEIFGFDGDRWQRQPGSAQDLAPAPDGTVWAIGTGAVSGGYGIWRLIGNSWRQVEGGGVRIAVDGRGNPWIVNDQGQIFRRSGNRWQRLPGSARDIAAGGSEVWIVGTDSAVGGGTVHRWTGQSWAASDGAGLRLAVGPDGQPWIANDQGRIFRRQSGRWAELPGRAHDIAVGSDGSAWVVGQGQVEGGRSLHRWDGQGWQPMPGGAVGIAVR